MPKRPVFTDPATKKAKKSKAEKKSVPTVPALLPLHASQGALAERVTVALDATGTALIVGKKDEPGLGKTRVAGKVVRDWLERETAEGRTALAVFVAKSAKLAHEQAPELGALETEAPWRMHQKDKLVATLQAHKAWTVMLTRAMFNKLVHQDHTLFVELVCELGVDSVLVVVDEAHELYKHPAKLPAALAVVRRALRLEGEYGVTLTVVGVTATPDLGAKPCRDGAMALFNVDEPPPPIVYTEEERDALCADHKQLPPAPTKWETIDLKTPVGNKACEGLMVELDDAIVNLMMAPTEGDNAKIAQRGAVKTKLAELCAKLAHGAHGGALVDAIKSPVDVRVVQAGDVLGGAHPGVQAVLVAHKAASATQLHFEALRAAATEGTTKLKNKLAVLDLGAGVLAERDEAVNTMLNDFHAQQATTVGFVSTSQHSGHNDFSKLASTVVAVGATWTEAELRQFFARVGRMGTPLDEKDVVPVAFTALHLDCAWARQVAKIDEKRDLRGVTLPEEAARALEAMKAEFTSLEDYELEEIELNTKKLVAADAFMKTKGALALKYLEAEAAYHRGEREATPTANASEEDE
jgi:hypothetical protein